MTDLQPQRRIAFISDPHGDLVALKKVIRDIEASGELDEVLVGGDLAQGGMQPSETIDHIRLRGWRSVRGNADDLLIRIADGVHPAEALREATVTHDREFPESFITRAQWSVSQLGDERIDYLRSLPLSLTVGRFDFGTAKLVHATPWSNEDVVLPDADASVAARMVEESGGRLVVYGHIHTPYQRRVGGGALVSVGAVSGSNDADPRPAYTIITLGRTAAVEVRRVDWPREQRVADYAAAGVDPGFIRDQPGPFPVRSRPGKHLVLGQRHRAAADA